MIEAIPRIENKKRIYMFAMNDILNDPRVQREAKVATDDGFSVTVFGLQSPRTNKKEVRDDYIIVRIKAYLPGYQIIRAIYRKVIWIGTCKKERVTPRGVSEKNGIENFLREIARLICIIFSNLAFIREGVKQKPAICHCNDLDSLLAGVLIKKRTGAKLIYDSHELWTEQDPLRTKLWKFIFRNLERHLIKRADQVITVNQSICSELENRYSIRGAKPIFNCPFYERIGKKKNGELKRLAGERKIILFQGRYDYFRGLEEVIKSAKYIKNSIIVFRGYGIAENYLRTLAREVGVKDKVYFVEPVKLDKLIEAASEADIGIIPYLPVCLNNRYSLPNKLFEYMMAGLAILASDLPELRKIISITKIGELFNPYKPKDIATKINLLTEDEEKLSTMKANSLKNSEERYNWEIEGAKLIKIYQASLSLPEKIAPLPPSSPPWGEGKKALQSSPYKRGRR